MPKKFNKEEQNILKEFDDGKLKSIKNLAKEKKNYQEAAKHTLSKSMTINIRISQKDLQKIKAIAAEKGLPYQTLITSILHQESSKRFI